RARRRFELPACEFGVGFDCDRSAPHPPTPSPRVQGEGEQWRTAQGVQGEGELWLVASHGVHGEGEQGRRAAETHARKINKISATECWSRGSSVVGCVLMLVMLSLGGGCNRN